MSYNAKNYTEQGGDVTHICGDFFVEPGGCFYIKDAGLMKVEAEGVAGFLGFNDDGYMIPRQTDPQANSEASTIETLKEDFNALLEKLRAVGIVAEE